MKQSPAQKNNFNGNGTKPVKTTVKGKATKGINIKHKAHKKTMA